MQQADELGVTCFVYYIFLLCIFFLKKNTQIELLPASDLVVSSLLSLTLSPCDKF